MLKNNLKVDKSFKHTFKNCWVNFVTILQGTLHHRLLYENYFAWQICYKQFTISCNGFVIKQYPVSSLYYIFWWSDGYYSNIIFLFFLPLPIQGLKNYMLLSVAFCIILAGSLSTAFSKVWKDFWASRWCYCFNIVWKTIMLYRKT